MKYKITFTKEELEFVAEILEKELYNSLEVWKSTAVQKEDNNKKLKLDKTLKVQWHRVTKLEGITDNIASTLGKSKRYIPPQINLLYHSDDVIVCEPKENISINKLNPLSMTNSFSEDKVDEDAIENLNKWLKSQRKDETND